MEERKEGAKAATEEAGSKQRKQKSNNVINREREQGRTE